MLSGQMPTHNVASLPARARLPKLMHCCVPLLLLLASCRTVRAGVVGTSTLATIQKGSEDWQKKFEDLKKTVDDFRKALPDAADKIDPLALKELYRDTKDLRQAVDELKKAIREADTREMAGSYRLKIFTNSSHVQTTARVYLYRVDDNGKAESKPTRELLSITARTSEGQVVIQGRDVGPGHYIVRRTAITFEGYSEDQYNSVDFRFDVERRTDAAEESWINVFRDHISGPLKQIDPSSQRERDIELWIRVK